MFTWLKKLRKAVSNSLAINEIFIKQAAIAKYQEWALTNNTFGVERQNSINTIVSLTTHSKRINEVHLTIESLFQQTQKANRIILWLSQDEFNDNNIPLILRKQIQRGLEIRYCQDVRSYTKLLPVLKIADKKQLIITVDDDYIYPYYLVENLYKTHLKHPECICYYKGSRIAIKNGIVQPYSQWKTIEAEYIPSILNFARGVGGILYPPNCFYKDIDNFQAIQTLAPKADDIWFKAMTALQERQYVKVPLWLGKEDCELEKDFVSLDNMQDIALSKNNIDKNENDKQIAAVFQKYNLTAILHS
jgi:hypothetical protein